MTPTRLSYTNVKSGTSIIGSARTATVPPPYVHSGLVRRLARHRRQVVDHARPLLNRLAQQIAPRSTRRYLPQSRQIPYPRNPHPLPLRSRQIHHPRSRQTFHLLQRSPHLIAQRSLRTRAKHVPKGRVGLVTVSRRIRLQVRTVPTPDHLTRLLVPPNRRGLPRHLITTMMTPILHLRLGAFSDHV